ncbi:MAG: hypothetical protein ABI321_22390 [Polyangia bacterium]
MKRATLLAFFSVQAIGSASAAPPVAAAPIAATVQKTPEALLADGKLAYERGNYALAVHTLSPLLYPSIALTSEEAVVEAHRLLALSHLLQKQEAEAEEEATSILTLRPSFQLDPIVDPPMAVAFFDGVRKKQESRLRELRAREAKEQEARAIEEARIRHATAERVYIEKTVQKHSRLLATIPFGVGQFQNGQNTKAALFLSSELLFGALSLSAYVALDQKYPYDPSANRRYFPAPQKGTAQALIGLQLGAGIAFWATLLWGIIDAHVLYKPQVTKTREVAAPKHSVSLAPIVGPGQGGLSVGGTF